MRRLETIDTADPARLRARLAEALEGRGPALLPVDPDATADPRLAPAPAEVDDAVAVVIATSGSTGHPKRVALSAPALRAGARATEAALGGSGAWVLALPAHLVSGLQVLVRSVLAGTEPVAVAGPHFRPAAFLDAAARLPEDARRYSSLVPAQVGALLDAAEGDPAASSALRRFDAILVGGQRTPPALAERARAAGVRIVRTYGSTETSGGCVYDGRALAGVELAIVDGEVWVSGATLASGYLDDPALTAAAFAERDGRRWYRTSDSGRLEDDGRLVVTGRLDNVLVSGGVNVSLDAVEAVVREWPGLAEAVVVAAPHPRWGQTPVVVVAGAGDVDLAALRAAVSGRLGRAAAPDRVLGVDVLPRLAGGKPDRVALATLASGRDEAGPPTAS